MKVELNSRTKSIFIFFPFRRRRRKTPTHRPVPKEMSLIESMELTNKKTEAKTPMVVASPMLNYDGKFPSSAETCFTVHGKLGVIDFELDLNF